MFELFAAYDAALDDMKAYGETIEGLIAKMDMDEKTLADKRKTHVKSLKDTLFPKMVREGVPRFLAKVNNININNKSNNINIQNI